MSQTLEQSNNENVQTNISTQQIPGGLRGHTAYLNPEDGYIYVSNNRQEPEFFSENKVAYASGLKKAFEVAKVGSIANKTDEFDNVELFTPRYQAAAEDYFKHVAKLASVGRTAAAGKFGQTAKWTFESSA